MRRDEEGASHDEMVVRYDPDRWSKSSLEEELGFELVSIPLCMRDGVDASLP